MNTKSNDNYDLPISIYNCTLTIKPVEEELEESILKAFFEPKSGKPEWMLIR